jgi:hypothetical protein
VEARVAINRLYQTIEAAPRSLGSRALSCWPSPWDPRDFKFARIAQAFGWAAVQLPSEWSFRPNLPPAWDQGPLGTCVAAASCWGVKAWQEIQQGDFPSDGLSVAFLYAMCKQRDGIPDLAGTYPRVALKVLQGVGTCTEAELPYSWLKSDRNVPAPPSHLTLLAERWKIKTYAAVCSSGDTNRTGAETAIKQAIYTQGPVLAAVLVCENFLDPRRPDYLLPLPRGRVLGGHAVALTGWSDRLQAFELRNSWGMGWGDNGYAWLPYQWLTARDLDLGYWYFFEAWSALDVVIAKPATEIRVKPGAKEQVVDGVRITTDQPAVLTEAQRMLAPVRFLASNMGYLVEWSGSEAVLTRVS